MRVDVEVIVDGQPAGRIVRDVKPTRDLRRVIGRVLPTVQQRAAARFVVTATDPAGYVLTARGQRREGLEPLNALMRDVFLALAGQRAESWVVEFSGWSPPNRGQD